MNDLVARAFAFLAFGFLSSCSVPSKQILPIASEEKTVPNKSLIIVERSSTAVGGMVSCQVYDNSTHVGDLGPGGKLVWLRDPGPMNITIDVDYNLPGSSGILGRNLTVSAGKRYYYNFNVDRFVAFNNFKLDGPGSPRHGTFYQPPNVSASDFTRSGTPFSN